MVKEQKRTGNGGVPDAFTRWKRMWRHHNRGIVWDTAAARWVGEDVALQKRTMALGRRKNRMIFKRAALSSLKQ